MSNVWYVGSSTSRTISEADWDGYGIQADTITWNAENGWSVQTAVFNADQLLVLEAHTDFLLGQDGPRMHRSPDTIGEVYASAYVYAARVQELYDSIQNGEALVQWKKVSADGVEPVMWRQWIEETNTFLGAPTQLGTNGRSVVAALPSGDGTEVQFYTTNANGDQIPLGDPLPVSIAYNSTITHGDDPNVARPPVSVAVIWIGSVQPNNALAGDRWDNTAQVPPTIVTTVLNGMNIGAVFNQQLQITGTTPAVWTKLSGTLPAGLTLSTEGNLFGLPTTAATYTFDLQVENPAGTAHLSYTVTVGSAVGPTITTLSLGTLQAGTAYSLQATATGSATITWDTSAGAFPAGVTMNSAGLITGTPTTIGTGSVTLRATNGVGNNTKTIAWSVVGVGPTITTASLNTPWRAFSAAQTLAYSGSSGGTWTKTGSFPTGVSMNSSGVISGSPSTAGETGSVSVTVTNAYGTDSKTFSWTVGESTPAVVETALTGMVMGSAYSKQITLSTGGPTITWSKLSGTLPTGVTWDDTTHTFSGTPTASGSGSVVIRADNGVEHDDQTITWSVIGLNFENMWYNTAGASSPLTIATNASAHAYGFLVVSITGNVATPTVTATYNGTDMPQWGSQVDCGTYGSTYRTRIAVYKLADLAGGAKNCVVTPGAGVTGFAAYFISATGVGTVGALQTKANQAGNACSQAASGTAGNIMINMIYSPLSSAIGSYAVTPGTFNASQQGGTNRSACGVAPSAGTVTFSGTGNGTGGWGACSFELAA